ncbi:hypothetical protein [uncultured Amphritea sp.]|uniref:hypothetical protein n=1 Tax=uncultured Amphritea sp. TaxID=981605 RepID=UPI0026306121|nr:hypothetical protein [uncultured Amphritea sp.]
MNSRQLEGFEPKVQKTVRDAGSVATEVAAHQVMAGHIQRAISKLPPPLQMLGHWLYAPDGVFPDSNENAIWQMVALLSDITDPECDEWYLARCALHCYKQNVWGRDSELNKARAIGEWLYEQHGVDINSRRFSVKYGIAWDRIRGVIDDLDKRALMPVARVVWLMTEDMSEASSFDWDGHEAVLNKA